MNVKSFLRIILAVALIMVVLSGCSKKEKLISSYEELNSDDYTVGYSSGSACSKIVNDFFPNSKTLAMGNDNICFDALINNETDAIVMERSSIESIIYDGGKSSESVTVLGDALDTIDIAIGLPMNSEYKDIFNEFIASLENDGTLAEMKSRWFIIKNYEMPSIDKPQNTKLKIKIGTNAYQKPYSYINQNGELTGFDIELIKRFALYAGAKVEIITDSRDVLINGITDGSFDAVINCIEITDNLKEKIDFSDVYYTNEVVVCVNRAILAEKSVVKTIDELNSPEFTVITETGSACAIAAEQKLTNVEHKYSTLTADCFLAVLEGKVDAYVIEQATLQKASEANPAIASNVSILGNPLSAVDLAIGIQKDDPAMEFEVNEFIATIKEDGTLDDMINRWILGGSKEMPIIKAPENPDKQYAIGTCGFIDPWSYVGNDGELNGFDIELIKRFALFANAEIDIQVMGFDALIASLQTKKLNAVVSDLNITEERRKVINYSEPYYSSPIIVCVNNSILDRSSETVAKTKIEDLDGKIIGVKSGTPFYSSIKKQFVFSSIIKYDTFEELTDALNKGLVDAIFLESNLVNSAISANQNFVATCELPAKYEYKWLIKDDEKELLNIVNSGIEKVTAEESIVDIVLAYDAGNSEKVTVDEVDKKGSVRVFAVNTNDIRCRESNGTITGYEPYVCEKIMASMGYECIFTAVDKQAVKKGLENGLCDIVIGYTGDDIDNAVYSNTLGVYKFIALLKSDDAKENSSSIFAWIKNGINSTFVIENRWKMVVSGIKVTVILTVLSVIIGTLFGITISFPMRSKNIITRTIFQKIAGAVNGTPLVVILMVLYYIIFGKLNVSAILVSVIGLSFVFGFTVADLLNTGISAIPKGQYEAAKVLGYSSNDIFKEIIFPQAIGQMFGTYRVSIVELLKSTAIVGYVAVEDLTKVSDIIRGRTYDAFFPLISSALIYLVMVAIIVRILSLMERKLFPKFSIKTYKGGER